MLTLGLTAIGLGVGVGFTSSLGVDSRLAAMAITMPAMATSMKIVNIIAFTF
jgi:hypothetical protein